MKPDSQRAEHGTEWDARQAANRRLGWIFGGVALALFLIALWKYRPF